MVMDEALAPPAGSALVRVRCDDAGWIHRLPPVPDDQVVTVAVGRTEHTRVSDDDLASSGYRIVGPQPSTSLPSAVELLVPGALMAAHPDWWSRVLGVADQAFDLRLGPVQLVMGNHLPVHLGT
ncbi:hypothetical protein [Salsipaludibacter albus]|uniref:hypothetical protein n=1 Tax=Salsipaludibacter albus TaxID=2849650 RepID=UPI001EE46140|nr:hypothetical protein [Salsipaludibacter albus]MBY5163167.1 hypothetical protein [Salsipaludibacter albus]